MSATEKQEIRMMCPLHLECKKVFSADVPHDVDANVRGKLEPYINSDAYLPCNWIAHGGELTGCNFIDKMRHSCREHFDAKHHHWQQGPLSAQLLPSTNRRKEIEGLVQGGRTILTYAPCSQEHMLAKKVALEVTPELFLETYQEQWTSKGFLLKPTGGGTGQWIWEARRRQVAEYMRHKYYPARAAAPDGSGEGVGAPAASPAADAAGASDAAGAPALAGTDAAAAGCSGAADGQRTDASGKARALKRRRGGEGADAPGPSIQAPAVKEAKKAAGRRGRSSGTGRDQASAEEVPAAMQGVGALTKRKAGQTVDGEAAVPKRQVSPSVVLPRYMVTKLQRVSCSGFHSFVDMAVHYGDKPWLDPSTNTRSTERLKRFHDEVRSTRSGMEAMAGLEFMLPVMDAVAQLEQVGFRYRDWTRCSRWRAFIQALEAAVPKCPPKREVKEGAREEEAAGEEEEEAAAGAEEEEEAAVGAHLLAGGLGEEVAAAAGDSPPPGALELRHRAGTSQLSVGEAELWRFLAHWGAEAGVSGGALSAYTTMTGPHTLMESASDGTVTFQVPLGLVKALGLDSRSGGGGSVWLVAQPGSQEDGTRLVLQRERPVGQQQQEDAAGIGAPAGEPRPPPSQPQRPVPYHSPSEAHGLSAPVQQQQAGFGLDMALPGPEQRQLHCPEGRQPDPHPAGQPLPPSAMPPTIPAAAGDEAEEEEGALGMEAGEPESHDTAAAAPEHQARIPADPRDMAPGSVFAAHSLGQGPDSVQHEQLQPSQQLQTRFASAGSPVQQVAAAASDAAQQLAGGASGSATLPAPQAGAGYPGPAAGVVVAGALGAAVQGPSAAATRGNNLVGSESDEGAEVQPGGSCSSTEQHQLSRVLSELQSLWVQAPESVQRQSVQELQGIRERLQQQHQQRQGPIAVQPAVTAPTAFVTNLTPTTAAVSMPATDSAGPSEPLSRRRRARSLDSSPSGLGVGGADGGDAVGNEEGRRVRQRRTWCHWLQENVYAAGNLFGFLAERF